MPSLGQHFRSSETSVLWGWSPIDLDFLCKVDSDTPRVPVWASNFCWFGREWDNCLLLDIYASFNFTSIYLAVSSAWQSCQQMVHHRYLPELFSKGIPIYCIALKCVSVPSHVICRPSVPSTERSELWLQSGKDTAHSLPTQQWIFHGLLLIEAQWCFP